MNGIYEVRVTTWECEYKTKIYGQKEAIQHAVEASKCDNVIGLIDVIDLTTGEVILQIEDQIVVWVTGIGNLFGS